MGTWLKCDDCLGHFDKKGEKMYIIELKETIFVEDNIYQDKEYRHLQLCKKCFENNPLSIILKNQDRKFK